MTYPASDNRPDQSWKGMVVEVFKFREVIQRLIIRNFSGQIKQSFLGYIWIALPPIATTVVFATLKKANVVQIPMEGHLLPYVLFALVGTTVWQTFAQTVTACTTSIANAGVLVTKIYFPREVLLFSALGNTAIHGLIRILVCIMMFMFYAYGPSWNVLYIPLLVLPLGAFALGLAMFFAPVNTMMHDMSRLLEFAFQFGMFLTPTIYPTPAAPWARSEQWTFLDWQTLLYFLHSINPVSHFLQAIRTLIEGGGNIIDTGLICSIVVSFSLLALGWRFFHLCEPLLAERL